MLAADSTLVGLVGNRMFPIASIEEVAFPLIVYSRDYVTPQYDKSEKQIADTSTTVFVAAESYSESLIIAEEVVKALDKKFASYDGYEVKDARLTAAAEDYNNDTYIQTLTFTFTIKEK